MEKGKRRTRNIRGHREEGEKRRKGKMRDENRH